ncbi:MAG: FAD-dependent oxidoreductase [Treponema sp.]|nr:FAD-dependent oxidoreductase [Treponema sp.]
MKHLVRLNKRLHVRFRNKVQAHENDGCLFLEGELDSWDGIVEAGNLAVHARKTETRRFLRDLQKATGPHTGGVVNNIRYSGEEQREMRVSSLRDNAIDGLKPDVLVIGGGISGSTILRELSRRKLDILLVEKEHDLAMHASSRNDGMVHPGLDLRKGSWKYRYNRKGNALYDKLCEELNVDFNRSGQFLCFSNPLIIPGLYLSLAYWKWVGVPARVVLKKELHRLEPGLKETITAALYFPSAGVVCPYNLTIACGENAVQNGARISLDTAVLGMETGGGQIAAVKTNRGTVYPKIVINAAGVFADEIAAMAGDRFYSIHPRKGSNAILDKKFTQALANTIVAKLGTSSKKAHTKGGGVISTVHRNILIGPDAVETPERENFAVTRESIETTIHKFTATCARLNTGQLITFFTGVRAPVYEEDFIVCKGRRCANLIHAAGIQSPGLTAAPGIAVDVAAWAAEMLEAAGHTAPPSDFNPIRERIPHIAAMSDEERAAMIKQNADYGIILCRCEEVSKGEIIDSLRRPVPCDTVDGVKRRVRPGMGRCQGGFCGPLVLQLIAEEKGAPLEAVGKSGGDSRVLYGPTKGNV